MLNITDKQFHTLFGEAIASQDRDAYASDWALSSIWGDEEADLLEIFALCGKVWDIAHLTVAEIRANVGLTQAEFATRYCIPFRTVQNWEYRGGCPDYVRLMLARLSGLTDGIL